MFPSNIEGEFLYKKQRHEDEVRQIMIENEYRRAFRDASVGNPHRLQSFRSQFGSVATGLISLIRTLRKSKVSIDLSDPCPDPQLMGC